MKSDEQTRVRRSPRRPHSSVRLPACDLHILVSASLTGLTIGLHIGDVDFEPQESSHHQSPFVKRRQNAGLACYGARFVLYNNATWAVGFRNWLGADAHGNLAMGIRLPRGWRQTSAKV